MKAGDLVRWSQSETSPPRDLGIGIVLRIRSTGWARYRIDVLWGNGSFSEMLCPETLEVVKKDESR